MATSPMKKRFSERFLFPRRMLFLERTRNTCGRDNYVPMRAYTSLGPTTGTKLLKGSGLLCFASNYLHLRNTKLGCKSLTPLSSRMYGLGKRLRALA